MDRLTTARTHEPSRPTRRVPSDRLSTDSRGLTELLGLMLAFGLVMSLVVLLQVSAVPVWNSQVEYDHNQRVQQDMAALDDAVGRAAVTGAVQSVAVETGVEYPSRFVFRNPPPAAGALYTDPLGTLTISNAVADGEAGDYWTGDPTDVHSFDRQALVYAPAYNEVRGGATVVNEGGVSYRTFANGEPIVDRTSLVRDGRITVVLYEGSVDSAASGVTNVQVAPLGGRVTDLPITGAPDGASRRDVVLSFRSGLDGDEWDALLGDEYGPDPASSTPVAGSDPERHDVTLTLPGDRTYDLRIVRLGVGPDTRPAAPSDARYVVDVAGDGATVMEEVPHEFVLEVRDANNNPVAGVPVEAGVESGPAGGLRMNGVPGTTGVTDADGRLSIRVTTADFDGDAARDVAVRATIDGSGLTGAAFDEGSPTDVELGATVANTDASGVTVLSTPGADLGRSLNPSADGDVRLASVTVAGGDFSATFDNTGPDRSIGEMRVSFYAVSPPGNGQSIASRGLPATVTIGVDRPDGGSATVGIGHHYETPDASEDFLVPSGPTVLTFSFGEADGTAFDAQNGDYFVFSVAYDDGTYGTYFVAAYDPTSDAGDGNGNGRR
jgi:hypothetical protein